VSVLVITIHHVHARPTYSFGMARPRLVDEPRVSTQVRLPASLYDRLKSAAQDRDVSANLIVTRALTEFLDRLAPSDVVLSSTRETSYKEAG
jgi:hypothetical protein